MDRRSVLAALVIPIPSSWGGKQMIWWFNFDNSDAVNSPRPDIRIELQREDEPRFKRTYSKKLNGRAKIEIDIKKWSLGIMTHGTLIQPDGRRIYFDPDRIADKIIDPILVPLVEEAVRDIYAIDKSWRASKPSEYTDENGTVWRRAAG